MYEHMYFAIVRDFITCQYIQQLEVKNAVNATLVLHNKQYLCNLYYYNTNLVCMYYT